MRVRVAIFREIADPAKELPLNENYRPLLAIFFNDEASLNNYATVLPKENLRMLDF